MGNDLLGVQSCKCLRGPAVSRSLRTTGPSIRESNRPSGKPRGSAVMTVAHVFTSFHKRPGLLKSWAVGYILGIC